MTRDEAAQQLQALGFGEYEARAYVALLQHGTITGYQLARSSGIPRPNIYPVLDRLQQRGAVLRIEVAGGARYAALPAEEMLSRLAQSMKAHLDKARGALSDVSAAPQAQYVSNVRGYENVVARAEALIESAQQQLLAGVWAEESRRLSDAFQRALGRGVVLTTLCIQGCPEECGGCRGQIFRYPVAAGVENRWLVLAADGRELLAGQVSPDGEATAAVTQQEVLVAVAARYLQNTIAAAEIVRSLGPRLRQRLDPRALEALEGAGLATGGMSSFDGILSAPGERRR